MNVTELGMLKALNRIADELHEMNELNRSIAGMVEREDL